MKTIGRNKLKFCVMLSLYITNVSAQKEIQISVPNGQSDVSINFLKIQDSLLNKCAIHPTPNYTGVDTAFTDVFILDTNNSDGTRLEKIKVLSYYQNGKKNKILGYYQNNNIYKQISFHNCKLEGSVIIWYSNGNKESFYCYHNNQLIYPVISWYEDGSIKQYTDCKDDTCISRQFKNWCVVYEQINNKGEIGKFTNVFYYPGKGVLSKVKVNDGLQSYTEYYEDGSVKLEGNIYNNTWDKVGKWTSWHPNGSKESEGLYKDATSHDKASIKTGTWSFWDENAKLIRKEYWKDNVLQKEEKW